MTSLVFVDIETDGLHPGRRAWEIAMIRRDDTGERECRMFLPLDLKFSDPAALKIGGFWERHPMGRKLAGKPAPSNDPMLCEVPTPCEPVTSAHEAAKKVMEWTFGAHLVGANPAFDAQVLERLLRSEGYLPSWHHHLIDVETMAVGWLVGQGLTVGIPWKSDELADRCGVSSPTKQGRHTALGDTRWVRDWFNLMDGGVSS